MAAPHRERWILLTLLAAAIAVLVVQGPNWLARAIRERSVAVVEQACGPRSHITIRKVALELMSGDVSWTGVDIVQQVDSADTTWTYDRSVLISGHVDSVHVRGLSIWRLLFWKTLDLRSVRISGPHLDLTSGNRNTTQEGPSEGRKDLITTIRLDTLAMDSGSLVLRNARADRPRLSAGRFTFHATGLRAVLPHRKVPFSLGFVTAMMDVQEADLDLPPVYDAHIGSITIAHPDSLVRLRDIRLDPRKGPHEYGQVVKYETDLFMMKMDSLVLRGFDIGAALNARTLATGELRVAGTDLEVYRDKTLKDEPFRHKNMPARLLRNLPMRVCIDSLVVQELNVHYHEKDVVTPEYGELLFGGINAVAHGICTTTPEAKPSVHMVVDARVYEKAPIHFDFKTAIFDSSDHFSIHTHIGPLPFQVFNRMTNDLILVQATSGTIQGIDYTLEADENKASGRVDLEYKDLSLDIKKRDGTGEKNKLMSFLVNQLTHSKNVRDASNGFRHGDFTIDRYKDRQIFNYMWRGLREGMMATILPKVVADVKDAAQGKEGKKPSKRNKRKKGK